MQPLLTSCNGLDGPNKKKSRMYHYYWNDWYFGWGWILWFGIVFLLFWSMANWGYSYRAHRKYDTRPREEAINILDVRYARGEISREEYGQMRS